MDSNINQKSKTSCEANQIIGGPMSSCYKPTAKDELLSVIIRLERSIKHLQTLRSMLPTEMSQDQDEALWMLLDRAKLL